MPKINKSILIIGGSGILSAAVVDACIEQGFAVTMLNRGNNPEFTNANAELIICDARNAEDVNEKLKGRHFDVVVDFIVYNLEQLKLSLTLFAHHAEQYVFISSAQAYNTSIQKMHVETDETPQPLWSYSINKDECEKFLKAYSAENKIHYTIVRPGVNYDDRRIPYGVVPPYGQHWTIIARILAGKHIITWNHGQNRLNLTRVEDFAQGMVGLLGNKKAYNETFNVVGDYIYTWKEVLYTLGELLHVEVKTIDLPIEQYAQEFEKEHAKQALRGGRALDLRCSNEKMKKIVPHFVTKYDLKSGLKKTIAWCEEHKTIDYKWDAECDRTLSRVASGYRGRYQAYSQTSFALNLLNKCCYYIEYSKGKKLRVCYWKLIRKFIAKPLMKYT